MMRARQWMGWGVMGAALAVAGLLGSGAAVAADDWTEARTEFRDKSKVEDWKERRDAFLILATYDGAPAVEEILAALERETNAAVVMAGIEALGLYASKEAREALFYAARKGKPRARLLVLVALQKLEGPDVSALLLELAEGKDAPTAAQAAVALGGGEKLAPEAAPVLLKLLKHKHWQVRMAAARVLAKHPDEQAVPALAAALSMANGRDRNEIIAALEKASGKEYGNDPAAWKKLAQGVDPAKIQAKPKLAPSAFGIPIYGQRVVIVLDNSLRMGDPHPFSSERLRELSDPPDGNPIPWFRTKTNGQFALGHVKHLIQGFPKGTKFEVITYNEYIRDIFGGLTPVGTASKKQAFEVLDGLQTDNGIATYDALNRALDIAGPTGSAAWKSGPDEILFITVNQPTHGDVVEADVVAAAIALKARLRMVPIHAVGLHYHPYEMCKAIAARTGGVYVSLVE